MRLFERIKNLIINKKYAAKQSEQAQKIVEKRMDDELANILASEQNKFDSINQYLGANNENLSKLTIGDLKSIKKNIENSLAALEKIGQDSDQVDLLRLKFGNKLSIIDHELNKHEAQPNNQELIYINNKYNAINNLFLSWKKRNLTNIPIQHREELLNETKKLLEKILNAESQKHLKEVNDIKKELELSIQESLKKEIRAA